MPPSLTIDAVEVQNPTDVADEEWTLDMRVVEATTPLVIMMCGTDDGCGSTCSGSACNTSSNDPS
ncbi:FxLD family lanthipeptide [Nonomuraea bangladeshensis]|uniref:FxLD family lanthipeptide n=1 Tax=Nonomuraea bangladeshensis TaxID=404385 RepID=UPI0031D19B69